MGEAGSSSRGYPKSRRLLKRGEFLVVQRSGGVRVRHVVAVVRFRDDDGPARLGIVASRRVGNAVERNRGKRRVREWFRHHRSLPAGADLVVILRRGAPDLPFDLLAGQLDEATRRAVDKARRRRRLPGTPPKRG